RASRTESSSPPRRARTPAGVSELLLAADASAPARSHHRWRMHSEPTRQLTPERALSVAEPVEPSWSTAVVSCRALTKRYGERLAVDGATFSLEAGTVTGFLGPNGAGKTTTLRLLLGLAEPTAGEALVFGRRYRELAQPIRRVGAVLESGDFHPARSG